MTIEYSTTKCVEVSCSAAIANEYFITVQHRENGVIMLSAFIGNKQNVVIKISPSGGVFESKRMHGSTLMNAKLLLKKDSFNTVVSNSQFIEYYKTIKNCLVVEEDLLKP